MGCIWRLMRIRRRLVKADVNRTRELRWYAESRRLWSHFREWRKCRGRRVPPVVAGNILGFGAMVNDIADFVASRRSAGCC